MSRASKSNSKRQIESAKKVIKSLQQTLDDYIEKTNDANKEIEKFKNYAREIQDQNNDLKKQIENKQKTAPNQSSHEISGLEKIEAAKSDLYRIRLETANYHRISEEEMESLCYFENSCTQQLLHLTRKITELKSEQIRAEKEMYLQQNQEIVLIQSIYHLPTDVSEKIREQELKTLDFNSDYSDLSMFNVLQKANFSESDDISKLDKQISGLRTLKNNLENKYAELKALLDSLS